MTESPSIPKKRRTDPLGENYMDDLRKNYVLEESCYLDISLAFRLTLRARKEERSDTGRENMFKAYTSSSSSLSLDEKISGIAADKDNLKGCPED
jgi:hypothetical protein